MNLIGKKLLRDFVARHADARSQIESWEAEVEEAQWNTPHELKANFPKAKIVNNQAVFKICWNKYRIWVHVFYAFGSMQVKRVGTHKEYDKWDIN